jgi:hypothetical protein
MDFALAYLERGALWGLGKLLVLRKSHVSANRQYVMLAGVCMSYLRSSIRIVSMVKSRFHCARQGSLELSTWFC